MATEAQIKANKLNAQKSTGPKTAQGKAVSSRNATTHGLSAKAVILEGENPLDFDALRERLFVELSPETLIEAELVEQLAGILWRLRRVPVYEAALTEWVAFRTIKAGSKDPLAPLMPSSGSAHGSSSNGRKIFVHTGGVTLEKLLEDDLLSKLGRHEAHLRRELQKTLGMLSQFKEERLSEAETPGPFDDEEGLRRREIEERRERYRELL